jgi:hypothetical protein
MSSSLNSPKEPRSRQILLTCYIVIKAGGIFLFPLIFPSYFMKILQKIIRKNVLCNISWNFSKSNSNFFRAPTFHDIWWKIPRFIKKIVCRHSSTLLIPKSTPRYISENRSTFMTVYEGDISALLLRSSNVLSTCAGHVFWGLYYSKAFTYVHTSMRVSINWHYSYSSTDLRLYTSTKLKIVNYWLYWIMHKKQNYI